MGRITAVVFVISILRGGAALELTDARAVAVIGWLLPHLLDRPADENRAPVHQIADPFTYFLRIRGKHRLHENTEALLEKLLVMLRDEGEEKTFGYIRAMLKEDKHGRNR